MAAGSASNDSGELAGFGYKQELDRSLGNFSSFAAGFSYISILTGMFELFGFGYLNAGPAVWWTWLIVLSGQMLVALCFAELAGQYPLAGSVYQWSKRVAGDFTAWMTGWIYIVGSFVTVAAVAVAWQVVLPQVSTSFEFIGTSADAGTYGTPNGAKNAIILGAILVVFATIINMLGVKIMARINNFGVLAELIGSTILVILLLFHIHRGPQIVVHNLGLGAGHSWGFFGAFIVGGIMSAYVMYGFDTAGTLAEETNDPRRAAPPAIWRALIAAGVIGGLLLILAMMDVRSVTDKNIGVLGLPYIVKQALGSTLGDIFLIDSAIAITVCTLAIETACIRLLFAMARDGRLPFGHAIARVSGRRKVPIVPALVTGTITLALLALNIANQSAFLTLTSVAIVMFYLCYLGITVPLLMKRLRGTWPKPDHGPYFSLGRWGTLVNLGAVVYGAVVAFNIAWPRAEVYGSAWYFKWGAYEFIGATILIGMVWYFSVYARKPIEVIEAHRADPQFDLRTPVGLGEMAP
ncbi:MAG TPA: amino acid permease [Solirubrobacteraceae bacterium]|jgi:urea carboxylase system permease